MRRIFSVFVYPLFVIAFASGSVNASETPPIVKKRFEAYVASHPKEKSRSADKSLERSFADFFFIGLTRQNEMWTLGGIEADAYHQGQSFWRDHPKERDQILASYGYVRVDVEGLWQCGFEQSSFTPSGEKNEEWWVSSFRGASWGNLMDSNCNKTRTRIVGYLSPIGHHGHLGLYQREIFFTSLTKLDR